MDEFFYKLSFEDFKVPLNGENPNITFVNYDNIKTGEINDLYNIQFPEENFIDFFVNDTEKKLKLLKLNTYRFQAHNYKSVIIFFHGLNSHINSGAYTAKLLSDQGYEVVGYDHRGFGKSEGLRGYIEDFDILYNDAKKFLFLIKSIYKESNIFLLGISMGGLISYKLSLDFPNDIKGLVLISPALKPIQKDAFVGFGIFLGWILDKPQLVKGKVELAMKNEISIQKTKEDPYVYNEGVRFGTLKALLKEMKEVRYTFNQFKTPVLIFVGGEDKIIGISGSFELLENCESKDKHLYYYSNLFHDVWNEEEIFDVADKIIAWINDRN